MYAQVKEEDTTYASGSMGLMERSLQIAADEIDSVCYVVKGIDTWCQIKSCFSQNCIFRLAKIGSKTYFS